MALLPELCDRFLFMVFPFSFFAEVTSSASLVPVEMHSPAFGVVEPPSALPSFIESPSVVPPENLRPNDTTSVPSSKDSSAYNPAASAFYPKTFR